MLIVQQLVKDLYAVKLSIERIVLNTQTVEDFASYKFLIGKINGLDSAISICHGILKEVNNDTK